MAEFWQQGNFSALQLFITPSTEPTVGLFPKGPCAPPSTHPSTSPCTSVPLFSLYPGSHPKRDAGCPSPLVHLECVDDGVRVHGLFIAPVKRRRCRGKRLRTAPLHYQARRRLQCQHAERTTRPTCRASWQKQVDGPVAQLGSPGLLQRRTPTTSPPYRLRVRREPQSGYKYV